MYKSPFYSLKISPKKKRSSSSEIIALVTSTIKIINSCLGALEPLMDSTADL